jgi:uncharacterized repeat protein (TIGR03806 family)
MISLRTLLLGAAIAALAACHSSGPDTAASTDTTPPGAPTGVTATATSMTAINVSWDAATDTGSGVKDYIVYRDGANVATVTTTSFADSGLTPGVRYSYHVSARDNANNESTLSAGASASTFVGSDVTSPGIPTGLNGTPTGTTSVSLSWSAATDAGGSGLKDYVVYRDGISVASVTTTSFSDSGLAPSTSYSYQVSARDNADNESSRSAAASILTLAASDTSPPTAPTELRGTPSSGTSIGLAWRAASDSGGSGLKDYRVYRDGVNIATVTTTSFADSGLTPNTSYSYQVSARDNADNESGRSAAVSASTPATVDSTAPTVPTGLNGTPSSGSSINLTWSPATDTGGSGLKDYLVYRNGTHVATVLSPSFVDNGLTPNTSYSYRVSARDNADNESNRSSAVPVSTSAAVDTTAPSVPTGLSGTPSSGTSINVTWTAATDTGGSGLKDYVVYRDGVNVATVTTTSYADSSLTPSTTYEYRVSARDNANNESSRSTAISASTSAAVDTAPPSVPTGLSGAASSATSINLTWNAATDTGGSGLKDYVVYRDGTNVAVVTTTGYADSGLTASTSYSYQISARDNANNESNRSTAAAVSTSAAPDTAPPTVPTGLTGTSSGATSINLAWNAATDAGGSGLKDYVVYRDDTNVAVVTMASYSDSGLAAGTSYSYRVSARDNANNESNRSAAAVVSTPTPADTTAPSVPSGLTTAAPQSTSVAITWNAATDTGGSGVRDYRLYRNNVLLTTVTGTSHTDTTVAAGTQYSYQVSARDNALNESARSGASSVTTPTPSDTTAPSVPGGLTTTATQPTAVVLSWNATTDTGGSGMRDYRIYRDNALLTTVTGTSHTDTTVVASTTYAYQVSARDNALNESARTSASNVTTPAAANPGLDTRPSNTTCIAPARTVSSATISITTAFNLGFTSPVAAVQAPGDSSRWFIVERGGRIMTFNVSNPSPTVFLDISSAIRTAGEEEAGLLGLAFHPSFASNGKLYVFYSGEPDSGYRIQSRIAEFTSANGTTVNSNTERILIRANKAESNHNGGQLAFGPDGFLYASLGDGGAGDDPLGNGQSVLTLFGKIIRINIDATAGSTPYAIPASNPYAQNATCPIVASGFGAGDTSRAPAACAEIYAYGMRNPWRFSLDRGSPSPDLWVGDVGQGAYEEINRVQLGGNYGWDTREGPSCHEPSSGCSTAGMIDPIAAAPRSSGLASIIGGFVYRGSAIPSLVGRYLFTDFFTSGIYAYDSAAANGYTTLLNNSGVTASAFAEANDGELYLVNYATGALHRIEPGSGSGSSPVPADLSQTGCVAANPTQPASGLVPFAPNAPFWSDHANKERWMGLPNGTTVSVGADGDWSYPTGTVLMKNFRLQGQLIETRLLMRHPDGEWAGYTYQWNSAQTAATRVIGGAVVPVGTPSQDWIYPSEAQCLQCHTAAAGRSLGPETAQLNSAIVYPETGRTANQISTLEHVGILPSSMPDASTLPVLPDPHGAAPLAERARAYLHTNCSFCHRPGGGVPGAMDLRYTTNMSATNTCNVTPTSGDLGVSGARLITPANPGASVLHLRMARRGANQMPPVGSNIVDSAGVALIEQWILQMNGTCG